MDRYSYPAHAFFLFAAIIIYGLFGSPTPDHPGLTEMAVGGLLILSVITAAASGRISFSLGRNGFFKAVQMLFLCGLVLPSVAAIYFGNDRSFIIRDVAAFAFLGLPLFLSEKLARHKASMDILPVILSFAGFAFAVRSLIPVFNIWIPQGELLYLSNSPLAMFAALFCAGAGWIGLVRFDRKGIICAALCAIGLAVILAAMFLDVQRATIGAVIVSCALLAAFSLIESPKRAILPIVLALVFLALCYPLVDQVMEAMARKTAMVGFNSRIAEAQAVFTATLSDPVAFFMGRGWGSTFSSPAVAGLEVNYTHSLLTTLFLKGGIILFLLGVLVLVTGLYQIFLIFQRDKAKALCLIWPFIIPIMLYASHKSMDFGLVLLLLGVWSIGDEALQKSHASDRKKGSLRHSS